MKKILTHRSIFIAFTFILCAISTSTPIAIETTVSYFTDFGTDSGKRNCNYDFGLNVEVGAAIPKPYAIDFSVSDIILDPENYGWMGGIRDTYIGALSFAVSNDLNFFWAPRFEDPARELGFRESQDHWSTIPKTEYRMLKEDNTCRLYAKAANLVGADMKPLSKLYFTVRYFDNAAEPFQFRIAKVGRLIDALDDRMNTTQIGVVAPLNDLRWHTVQFKINPDQALAYSYKGTPVFQILIAGTGKGNHVNVMGNIGLDMAKLSNSSDKSEFPANAPVVEAALPREKPPAPKGFVDNEGKPFFPILALLGTLRTGDWIYPTKKTGTSKSSWEIARDAGFNTVGYWNYNALLWDNDAWNRTTITQYGKQWTDYMDNVNTTGAKGGPGLWAVLDHCNALGLKVVIDITEKFRNLGVQSGPEGYRTSAGALKTMMRYLAHNRVKNNPAVWAIYPFDEYAHDYPLVGFISVPEATQIHNAVMRAIPGKYIGAIHMMYETTPTSAIWGKHAFDFDGCDYYALDDGYDSSTNEQNFDRLVEYLAKVRKSGNLNLPDLRWATGSHPELDPQGNDLSSQIYLAITQEVDGVALYGWRDPDYDAYTGKVSDGVTKTSKTAIWKRTRQVIQELHALTGKGVPDAVLHKQEGIDISSHARVTGGQTGDRPVFIYKKKISNNARYLICTRLQNKRPANTVYHPEDGDYTYSGTPKIFNHFLDDMPAASTTVQVLFENRTITPKPYGTNGLKFTDGYESRGRHVYKLVSTKSVTNSTPPTVPK